MTAYVVPFIGERDFSPSPNNSWTFKTVLSSGHCTIRIYLKNGELDKGLKEAGQLFPSYEALDQAARHAIRLEYEQKPSTSEYFVRYFKDRYSSEELSDLFGSHVEDIGLEELLAALQINVIRYNLGQAAEFLVLDYRLDADESGQILVVYFNSGGTVNTISMES